MDWAAIILPAVVSGACACWAAYGAGRRKGAAEALKEAAQSEVVGVCYLDTGPYHATSPKEDATCLNLSAGSPVSSA